MRLMSFLDPRHKLFLGLAGTFVTCLLVGDIIGGKLIEGRILGLPYTTTVGMIPFPVTFLLTDLLNEYYGPKAARFVTWLGFGMAILAFSFIYLAGTIPIAAFTRDPSWQGVNETTFANVFLGSQRMLLASLCAYLFSQLIDIFVFHSLRRWSNNRFLWLRATGSTATSQLIDTIVITFVAWSGILSLDKIVNIIFSAYGLKLLIAVGLTPLLYLAHALVQKGLGLSPLPLAEAD
jgi:queuosine precursor transporter